MMRKLAVFALLGVCLMSLYGCNRQLGSEPVEATAEGSETVMLDGAAPVVLDVRNGVGKVLIRAGVEGSLSVAYTLTAYAETKADAERELAAMRVAITQQGGRVQVNAVQSQFTDHARTNKVDLTITAPAAADLIVRNDVGDVEVRGIRTPQALEATVDVGNVTLHEVEAGPETLIRVDVGDIRFEGTLAPSGSASLKTGAGKVNIRLPRDTSATLNASTAVGKLTLDGLAVSRQQRSKQIPGETLTATLGSGGPSLELSANVGDITVGAS